jgi:hypothetical protein
MMVVQTHIYQSDSHDEFWPSRTENILSYINSIMKINNDIDYI